LAPSFSFRGQPFRAEDAAGSFLERVLSAPDLESLTVVVAWARFGGLRRFEDEICAFRERGGHFQLIAGIDEGVATVPGLQLAIELADSPFVFHDRGARTFHPKIYLAQGSSRAMLLVGSSNLTAGGLYSNYEASLEAEFQLPAEAGEQALTAAREYVAALLADEELCLPLDEDLLERLIADPRYAIAPDERRRTPATEPPEGAEVEEVDQHGQVTDAGEEIFGTSRHAKAPARPLPPGAREEAMLPVGNAQSGEVTGEEISAASVARWTKVLPASDAQHPPSPNSNPLGNMRLTKAGHQIDWLTWFRHELFGPAAWQNETDRKGNPIEVAEIPFAVTIAGESLGVLTLRVDHAPHRESGQSNHASVLHWGPLAPILRETNYSDYTLTLERLVDDSYRLEISL
jgi:hypothetical protein